MSVETKIKNISTEDGDLKVHIIDDDNDDVLLIKEILNNRNSDRTFDVSHSGRINDGIEALKRKSAHVILLDLSLPDASGFEGLLKLQEEFPFCNIIILTGLKDQEMALKALQKGASDFLNKNEINPVLLSRTILFSHERQKLEEQLRQSRKLEAIGHLAGGIAHDFNNQLAILMMLLDQTLEKVKTQNEVVENIGDMISIVDKCASMTKQILGFSRKQDLYPKILHINSMIENILPIAGRLLGSEFSLDCEISEKVKCIYVDTNQLEQVLWNLIVNAKQALDKNKKITIRTDLVSPQSIKGFVEKVDTDKELVMIEVADTGSGIDENIIGKIFDPFFTTKPTGEGTGLGLSSALGFIRQSGGYLAVNSKPQVGTSFKILFPPCKGEVDLVDSKPIVSSQQTAVAKNIGVLICEDEPVLLDLLVNILEEYSFKIFKAENGLEGQEIYQKHSTEIDLILTDLTMPKMNGIDLISKIQKDRPDLHVIVMTGFNHTEKKMPLQSDKIDIIEKPFSVVQLKEKVNLMLDRINHQSVSN
jgi:two-component system, cell cycle sensor histidine kinase and response regulator CckA